MIREKEASASALWLTDPDEFIYTTLLSGDLALVGTKRPEATHVVIPDCVAVIQEGAFADNQCLKSIVIPETVTTIEEEAFMGARRLESVALPASLVSIGHRAFFGCASLKEGIAFYNDLRFVGSEAFGGCDALLEIPCESEELLADRQKKDAIAPSLAPHVALVLNEKDASFETRFRYAMDIGERMLRNGAEVSRVEDSLDRICIAMGAKETHSFVITSLMIVTVKDEKGTTYTETRRIRSLGTNFEKLDKLNALSRKICAKGFSVKAIDRELDAIELCKPYSVWVSFAACALIASAFTLFFGGNLWQARAALFIGCCVHLTDILAERTLRNPIFCKFASASVLTALVFFV
ncbi:MAG: threonine/serine exporter family protein, partial [Clostridia bacterium]|nr:threonine/serine exporter family protein [Clostridia bacterium]